MAGSRAAGLLAGGLLAVAACSIDARDVDAPGDTANAGAGGSMSSGPEVPGGAGTGDAAGAGGTSGAGGAGPTGEGSGGTDASGNAGSTGASAGAAGAGGDSGTAGANGGGAGDGACPANLLANGDFEAGEEGWVSFSTGGDPLIYDSSVPEYEGVEAHAGQRLGWLGGVPSETNRLSQAVSVPPGATRLGLRYSLRIQIFEQHATIDFLRLRLVIGGVATPIAEFSNADAGQDWVDYAPEPLAITAGQPLAATLEIESSIGDGPGTNFFVDDVALVPTCAP